MLVLGLSGGIDPIHANVVRVAHDSAAVLLDNGKIVAAIEEERLNRVKHTNKFPANAIRLCLERAGAQLRDVDRIAMNYTEENSRAELVFNVFVGRAVSRLLKLDPAVDTSPRRLLQAVVERDLGVSIGADRFFFVKHHVAHAFSAFVPSGFDRALVVTMDGEGEGESGYVATADERGIEILRTASVKDSVGWIYSYVTHFLGFKYFDEFKVMGLVPYGDPSVHRDLFRKLYTLKPEGAYEIHRDALVTVATTIPPRHPSQPFDQRYKDVAAALQEMLETIAFHVIEHFRSATGIPNLCFAGGVAHNCTLNGKLLASGLFSKMYVQPASHDAGCALGAAYHATFGEAPGPAASRGGTLPHLYLGSDIGDARAVEARLKRWETLLSIRESAHVTEDAAKLLAGGSVIGWVQGRSEFGPRALGNRSILADPRPPENKEIINAMVKKREGFRPFAPAVVEERAAEYFEVPEAYADLGHMTYVLPVRQEQRALLGAITHVDGSARVQGVKRDVSPRFWDVIHAFGEITGLPVLLNTSFNNNAEPIVDSVDDAVVCFLTTKLNQLVVGDFVIDKREVTYDRCRPLVPSLCRHVSLRRVKGVGFDGRFSEVLSLVDSDNTKNEAVSSAMWQILDAADGERTLGSLVEQLRLAGDEVIAELVELWTKRLIVLFPPSL